MFLCNVYINIKGWMIMCIGIGNFFCFFFIKRMYFFCLLKILGDMLLLVFNLYKISFLGFFCLI